MVVISGNGCVVIFSTIGGSLRANSGLMKELVEVVGMLKRREEYSGLSMESDLRDDEEDEGGFVRAVVFGSVTWANSRIAICLEKSSGNKFIICISKSTC